MFWTENSTYKQTGLISKLDCINHFRISCIA